jgi:hypothetical protein
VKSGTVRSVQPDDTYWRRPAPEPPPAAPAEPPAARWYLAPPPTTPPPAGWLPPRVVQPAPARQLPAQDHERIDAEEAKARTLTQGMGIITGAVLLVLLFALCGRLLF